MTTYEIVSLIIARISLINLPSPDVLADEIIDNLQSALDSFRELKAQLKCNQGTVL